MRIETAERSPLLSSRTLEADMGHLQRVAALTDAANRFPCASRQAVQTADQALQAARADNEQIAAVNQDIASRLAAMNARVVAW
jgi:predicted NBD/HSP70 family sugar kinase